MAEKTAIKTWYYGFALGVEPSKKDTGGFHDIGDGIYLAADLQTARAYAKLREGRSSSLGTMVLQAEIDMDRFRVLDLVNDPKWNSYLTQNSGHMKLSS